MSNESKCTFIPFTYLLISLETLKHASWIVAISQTLSQVTLKETVKAVAVAVLNVSSRVLPVHLLMEHLTQPLPAAS
uniref:Uncharacterized protein n=1 Tax=Anguilla anguilla TaxID=7936 RepID=A0A0E9RJD0_ANGAN